MKRNSLVSKLLGTFTLIIAGCLVIIAIVLSFWFENYHFNQKKQQLDIQASLIAKEKAKFDDEEITFNDLEKFVNYSGQSIKSDILVTDLWGIVKAYSEDKSSLMRMQVIDSKNLNELKNGISIEVRNTDNKMLGESQYIYYKPIMYGDTFAGAIVMITPLEQIKGQLKQVYAIIWITVLIALILSSIIIYYVCNRMLIIPLAKINIGAKRLAKGDIENRVYINSKDEIGELADSFNIMAESLEEVEKNRREFISNVSHELRSPITSIKGFIAGILDGIIPIDKEKYYLGIAYEEIQRLTRLINDLLDLSAMEAGKLKLNVSEININEIIKHCTISLEQKIKEKKLKVDVVLEGQNLNVAGDKDRIIQVVNNLIDNAIKYCNESGNVKITTRSKGSKALISVYNDGPMLSEKEKAYIWDRFYKSDKSRTNKISTGLGLPIVRHILSLHGEDIWVENKASDKGVVFTFSLKKV
ncbi:sensor histidine kinase [Clostridium fungisolvens]|uniref:histidine kinase n=1 Tax=Clostridium fungisolvens TaxID=1604897 RepID=A0A6V8SN20_9CLOT|nr:HAMP domain-containing sensor histidine kinase [Clostridium fungisolvens]GFP77962.1 Signal transduction histidine-protein kinase BaeS [Clostridium fungisolvens]